MSQPASGRSTPTAGHALPARPPPVQGGGLSFKPRNVSTAPKPSQPPQTQTQYASSGYDMNGAPYGGQSQGGYAQGYGQQGYGGSYAGYDQAAYTQPAQTWSGLNNPSESGAFNQADAEWQAQVQAWQANYSNPSPAAGTKANATPLGTNVKTSTSKIPPTTAPLVPDTRKTVVRSGGGQKWEDSTLLEWGNHHRIFVGNLAGEVTDESLLKAFAKFPSVQKARVIRDKRTTKSKGFGFVSFSDADEYFQAAKEMQGKYIGSHPVLIKRAETEIKASNKKTEDRKQKGKYGKANANLQGAAQPKDPMLGPQAGGGVQKNKKPDSKYKLLG